MFTNNLLLAFRNLSRRKIYSAVIILSLTFGFAFANLLISFLIREQNTDVFHTKKDRLFQLFSSDPFEDGTRISYILNKATEHLAAGFPEVESAGQVYSLTDHGMLRKSEDHIAEGLQIVSVDSSFFNQFDFPLRQGNTRHISPNSIILSAKTAAALFGETNPIGQTIVLQDQNTEKPLIVDGVLDQLPEHSHLKFDALVSQNGFGKQDGGITYVLLRPGSDPVQLQQKINRDIERPGLTGPGITEYFLEPIRQSYYSPYNKRSFMVTRSQTFIWVGWMVAGLMLFIASFNFINLFLMQFQERRKEFGVKKVLGITRIGLIKAAMVEVLLYIGGAYLLSLLLTLVLLPEFNASFEATLSFSYLSHVEVISALGGITWLLAVIAVIVSVWQQARIQPVSLLKRETSYKISFNKWLFTLQFVVSTALIICSVTIIRQISFIEQEPLGFNRNLIQVGAPSKELAEKLPVLKQLLRQNPAITQVCLSSGNPISGNMMVRYDLPNEAFYAPYLFSGDDDLLKTLGLTLVQGTSFSKDRAGKIVNEKLVRQFNMSDPIGQTIPGTKEDKIIGVVRDFRCVSLKEEIPPVIISYAADVKNMLIGYNDQPLSELLPQLERSWQSVFPNHPFKYSLIQEDLLKKHKEDIFFYKIIISFSVASILISCFGLFALSWGTVQRKTREIGIRKVLGASVPDIVSMLSRDFLKLVLLSFFIASPIAWVAMSKWLEDFTYRINLGAEVFVMAGVISLLIALLTVSFQSIKAALMNPVKSLRNE